MKKQRQWWKHKGEPDDTDANYENAEHYGQYDITKMMDMMYIRKCISWQRWYKENW